MHKLMIKKIQKNAELLIIRKINLIKQSVRNVYVR